ncbi:MAG: hypothetical protein LBQ10_12100 [Desulfovibrio sp.]|nr:hypothetical protein [Desulfovibrio sp.]
MNKDIVLSCFDHTGNMVRPWAEAGYSCYCVDIRHPHRPLYDGRIVFVGADMLEWQPDFDVSRVVFQAYFPPCTDLAVSGARWFREKGLDSLIDALRLFNAAIRLAESIPAPYMIENPVSTVSTYWRKPDYIFSPCDFAGYEDGENDLYTKKTCLWCGNGFRMPHKNRRYPEQGSKMHLLPPSEHRSMLRAETPKGFARAVFEANGPLETPNPRRNRGRGIIMGRRGQYGRDKRQCQAGCQRG